MVSSYLSRPARSQPPTFGEELRVAGHVVGDDEPLHQHAVADHGEEVAGPGLGHLEVVLRDHAAEGDAREGVHKAQHRVHQGAAHVLEVDVDAVRAGAAERLVEVAPRVVVDGLVGARAPS